MTDTSRSARAPLAVSVTLVVVLAALSALATVQLRQRAALNDRSLTKTEQGAVDAAAKIAINISTFTRKDFEADFQRGLDSTTGDIRTEYANSKQKQLDEITTGKFDVTSEVSASALGSISEERAVVLVFLTGYVTNDKGQRVTSKRLRFSLTVDRADGKWLASNLQTVQLT